MKLLVLALSLAACSKDPSPPQVGSDHADHADPADPADRADHSGGRTAPIADAAAVAQAGTRAQRFATYKETKEGKPCPAYPAGQEVRLGDISYRFGAPMLAEPERRLPWIANSEERAALSRKGVKAMIIPMSIRNNAPIAQESPNGLMFFTSDGRWHYSWHYNLQVWSAAKGLPLMPNTLQPDRWYETAAIYDVGPDQQDGGLIYLLHRKTVRDRFGRPIRYIDEHAVVDLAPASPTDPIRGR